MLGYHCCGPKCLNKQTLAYKGLSYLYRQIVLRLKLRPKCLLRLTKLLRIAELWQYYTDKPEHS